MSNKTPSINLDFSRDLNTTKKSRDSNMELCRIVAMLLVVLVHSQFAAFGIPESFNTNSVVRIILESISIIGVNVFVLISGYYSINLKKQSILNLLFICLFYGIIILLLKILLGDLNFYSFFIISRSNWFIPNYLGLIIISPILNTWIKNCSKEDFKKILITLLLFECYFGFFPAATSIQMFTSGCSISSFVILYLLARYYRLYGIPFFEKINVWGGYIIATIVISLISTTTLYLGMSTNMVSKVFDNDNPLVIFSAFCFMIGFSKMKINHSTIINRLAASTLAVLIIHASSIGHNFLKTIYQVIVDQSIPVYLLLLIIVILAVYLICSLTDEVRIRLFNLLTKKNK